MATENTRGARKVRKGKVVSKMGIKSVVVEVTYREQHPIYGKVVVRRGRHREGGRRRDDHGNASAQRHQALAHRDAGG